MIKRALKVGAYAVLREPLVHFLLCGALIFFAAHVVQSHRAAADRQIVVDEQLRRRIVEISRAQSGITPRGDDLEHMLDQYVDDEVMYREALRLGLDRDDEIVRRRLIQKMQFVQRDLAGESRPDDNELRTYYESHRGLFASAVGVSFEQLYFSADRGGWTEAEARAARVRGRLRQRLSSEGLLDDAFPFQIPLVGLTEVEAGRLFGETPIVRALFDAPVGEWSEPVRSAYGWHLLRVSQRQSEYTTPFAEVRSRVESAYRQERSEAASRRELDAIRSHYEILRPALTPHEVSP